MEDNQSFDDIIQHKLKNFNVGYKPANWDKFAAEGLNKIDPEKDAFDVEIKSRLADHTVPYQSAHWAVFEHRLDASLHDTYAEELDQFVQGSLHNYTVGYDPQSWDILQQKILERRQYLRRLMLTKSTEAAIIIFALFTFFRFFPNFKFTTPDSNASKTEIISPIKPVGPDAIDIASLNTNSSSSPLKTHPSTKKQAAGKTIQFDAAQDVIEKVNTPTPVIALNQSTQVPLVNVDNLAQTTLGSAPVALSLLEQKLTKLSDHTLDLNARLNNSSKRSHLISVAHIDQAYIDLDKPLGDFTPAIQEAAHNPRFRLGVFGGADLNIVRVSQFELTVQPQKKPFIGVATDFVSAGYNAGMDLTYQIGRVMLETGIQYTQINYYNPENYYQLIREGLVIEKARYTNQANIIELPVHIHYRLSKSPDRFNTSFFAGVSSNVITKFTSEAFRTPSQANLRSNNLEAKSDLEQEFALFQLAIRNRFSIKEVKSLFYLDAGLNMEYLLTDRHGLFMQMGYNHPLQNSGFGGNQDVISQLSSKLGMRMSF